MESNKEEKEGTTTTRNFYVYSIYRWIDHSKGEKVPRIYSTVDSSTVYSSIPKPFISSATSSLAVHHHNTV